MNTKPIKIFISYNHVNEIWLTQYLDIKKHKPNPKYLLDFWERSLRSKGVEFWYDRDEKQGIRGGDRWRNRIFEEIDNADISILLITQDFIISPFIRDVELPRILNRSKKGKMELLPILLEPARLRDLDIDNTFQIVPGRPTPLCEYLESENEWKKVRLEVIESIENVIDKVMRKRNLSEPEQLTKTELVSDDSNKVKPLLTQNPHKESFPDKIKNLSWMMKTTTGPGERSGFGMIYDEKKEGILLHGGFGSANNNDRPIGLRIYHSSYLRDTWIWNGSSWQLLQNKPLTLENYALANNKSTQQNIIHGGSTESRRIDETYVMLDNDWVKTEAKNIIGPGVRDKHAMVYDEKRKSIILFGGLSMKLEFGPFTKATQIAFVETWEFKDSGWTKLHVKGPDPRWGHKMVYDKNIGVVVLFGGCYESNYFNDTWIWEGNTATWSKIATDNLPAARCSHAMTYDRVSKKVLLFGGKTLSDVPLNDLWEWDGNDWKLLIEHAPPKPRYNHGFVYDEKRNKSILFGGFDGKEWFQDTWEFAY